MANPFCHFLQRFQLSLVDQTELTDEVVKVLVAGVDVSFCTHADDAVKMVDVDVDKDPEEASEDLCTDLLEIFWERNTYPGRKDVLIIN